MTVSFTSKKCEKGSKTKVFFTRISRINANFGDRGRAAKDGRDIKDEKDGMTSDLAKVATHRSAFTRIFVLRYARVTEYGAARNAALPW